MSLNCLRLLQNGFKQTCAVELKTYKVLIPPLSIPFYKTNSRRYCHDDKKRAGTYDSTVYQCTFQNVRSLSPHYSTPHVNRITFVTKRLVTTWKPIFRTPEIRESKKSVHAHNINRTLPPFKIKSGLTREKFWNFLVEMLTAKPIIELRINA